MIDLIDIGNFILLENKYCTELEHYDKNKNKFFLKKCIKANEEYLDLMKDIQKIILKSSLIQDKTQDQFEKLRQLKNSFDEYLSFINRLSESMEIAITPKNTQDNKS